MNVEASPARPDLSYQGLPRGLRVALVHDWLTGMRGGEKVLEAIAELFPDAPIYTLLHIPGSVSPRLEARPIHTSFIQRLPGSRTRYRNYLPLFPSAIEDFDLSSYDLILSTSHCVAKGVVPGPDAVHFCYCHTPMRYAWDQEHVYFPKRKGLIARWRNLALTALRAWDVASVPRVDAFVANSHFVARRIARYYHRAAEVIPPPVEVDHFAEDPSETDVPARYALMVSALAPYKRVDLAIEACRELDLQLKIVGSGPEKERLVRMAGSSVEFCGRVSADELPRLYREAALFVQPGIEDFGIAAVEALAAGTPVVALGEGGVVDIVEHGVHGWLYQRGEDASALRLAIDKSLQIRFNKLDLLSRAQKFSRLRFQKRFSDFVARRYAELEVKHHDDQQASP